MLQMYGIALIISSSSIFERILMRVSLGTGRSDPQEAVGFTDDARGSWQDRLFCALSQSANEGAPMKITITYCAQ